MIWILIPIAALKGFHKGSIIYDTVNNLWKVIDASPSNDLKIGKDYTLVLGMNFQLIKSANVATMLAVKTTHVPII